MPGASGGSARVLAEAANRRASRWGDLGLRALSAAVLAPITLLCIWFGGAAFAVLLGIATIGMVFEWTSMVRAGALPRVATGGWWATGLGYILLAVAALAWLRGDAVAGLGNLLFLLLVVWCSDIGAYVAGRAVGGRRLAPLISPGKTVSGAVGGLLAAVLVGLVAANLVDPPSPSGHAAALGGLLGLVAQAGDLLESFCKRRFGVKDSGHLIPGHGGLLDRLDALLAVAIVAGLLALIGGRGVVLWK